MTTVPRFTVLSREGCELCEEMLAELRSFCGSRAVAIEVVDVDGDPQLRRRFGHNVPVLLFDGEPICHGRFDAPEVERLMWRWSHVVRRRFVPRRGNASELVRVITGRHLVRDRRGQPRIIPRAEAGPSDAAYPQFFHYRPR